MVRTPGVAKRLDPECRGARCWRRSGRSVPQNPGPRTQHPRCCRLHVRRVPAGRAGHHHVLAGLGPRHELGRAAAAHRPRVRLHHHRLDAAAPEDPLVRPALRLERPVQPGLVQVEGVGVLHRELADSQQAGLRAGLVAELGLDLVPDLGQLAIAPQLVAGQQGEDLLVGHAQGVLAAPPVGQAEHLVAHHLPAPALAPDLGRVQGRQPQLLAADRVHLLADDRLDLRQRAQRQRQVAVQPGPELPDEAAPDQQLVRDGDGVDRRLFQGGDEGAAHPRHCHRRPPRHRDASLHHRTACPGCMEAVPLRRLPHRGTPEHRPHAVHERLLGERLAQLGQHHAVGAGR